jgi:hypothetical protein
MERDQISETRDTTGQVSPATHLETQTYIESKILGVVALSNSERLVYSSNSLVLDWTVSINYVKPLNHDKAVQNRILYMNNLWTEIWSQFVALVLTRYGIRAMEFPSAWSRVHRCLAILKWTWNLRKKKGIQFVRLLATQEQYVQDLTSQNIVRRCEFHSCPNISLQPITSTVGLNLFILWW